MILIQLSRNATLVGMDYMIVACSKSKLGKGWCRIDSSVDEVINWLDEELCFSSVFPLYCQGKSSFASLLAHSQAEKQKQSQTSVKKNRSDGDRTGLTARLKKLMSESLSSILDGSMLTHFITVRALGKLPSQGFPRGEYPDQRLRDRKINFTEGVLMMHQ